MARQFSREQLEEEVQLEQGPQGAGTNHPGTPAPDLLKHRPPPLSAAGHRGPGRAPRYVLLARPPDRRQPAADPEAVPGPTPSADERGT